MMNHVHRHDIYEWKLILDLFNVLFFVVEDE